jgi:TetR/AcrR family transcriptional repressor of mexJK operon
MTKKPDEGAPKAPRGRPRDPERLQRILKAASSHFYAHGLERASVDAIAAEAGVSKMTVYSHFGSKEGLFEAVVRERTDRVMGGLAGVETLDPRQPQKALAAIGEQFLMLTRDEQALGKFRSVYGAAGAKPEACRAFYRQGPERLSNELTVYLRRAHAAGTLKVPNPRLAANLFLSMFMGDGHIRGLLMLDMPEAREDKALLREAVRVFLAGYAANA